MKRSSLTFALLVGIVFSTLVPLGLSQQPVSKTTIPPIPQKDFTHICRQFLSGAARRDVCRQALERQRIHPTTVGLQSH